MKKKLGYILCLMMSFFVMFMDVDAETAKYTYKNTTYCYKKASGKYIKTVKNISIKSQTNIEFACANSSTDNDTILKYLDGKDAYCPQANMVMPVGVSTCSTRSYGTYEGKTVWNETKALKAGAAIAYIQSKNYGHAKETVYIVNALNYILNFQGSYRVSKDKYVQEIQDAITVAEGVSTTSVKNFSTNPISKIAFDSSVLQRVVSGGSYSYSKGVVSASLVNNDNATITYKISCSSNCTVYSDSALTKTLTSLTLEPNQTKDVKLYVKSTNALAAGSKVFVTIGASATFKTDIAKYWNCKSGKQGLITLDSTSYYPAKSLTVTAVVPDPASRNLYFSKVDASGLPLEGADVSVSLSGDVTCSTSDGKCQCSTAGSSSCSLSLTSDATSASYEINEITAPSGYITSSALKGTWNVGTSTDVCYRSKNTADATDEEKSWVDVTTTTDGAKADCDISYVKKEVCLDENGQVKDGIATSEDCSSIGTGTNDETTTDDNTTTDGDVSAAVEEDTTTKEDETDTDETPEVPEENKWTWTTKCYNGDSLADDSKCQYDYMNVVTDSTSIHLTMTNTYNSVGFSKTDTDGNNISGAKLKVCAEADYDKDKLECTPYKTVTQSTDDEGVTWYSGTAATVFNGFAIGKYYLIEEKAAPGYILNNTPVAFSIDKNGDVTLENNKVADLKEDTVDIIMLQNEITKMSISKQDMATTAEVPGAQLSICLAYKDEEGDDYHMVVDQLGNCTPATLANGEYATWTSTDKPYDVVGLPAGTYFLVEKIAPKNYSTAESILFTLREDGILVNKDGNSLLNNKLVMYDAPLAEVKTGMLPFYIVFGTLIGVVIVGGLAYYFMNHKNQFKFMKFRKRKLHKMNG